jgi:hypothetical protein
MKHTPGPWFTLDTGLDVYTEYPQNDADYLPRRRHLAAAITTHQFDQEARANARLIAAAPELLQSLQAIVDEMCNLNNPPVTGCDKVSFAVAVELGLKAKAAIAKAKGVA